MQISRYLRDDKGASAAEFALVVIPFIGIVLGIIGLSLMLYANQTMQYAAEDAARCASVKSDCKNTATPPTGDATKTVAYAQSRYKGPGPLPTFVYSPTGCGHTVTATTTFPLNTGLVNISIPLSAQACFP